MSEIEQAESEIEPVMDSDERAFVGNLHGVARPAPHLRAAMIAFYGQGAQPSLSDAIDTAVIVEQLSTLIQESLTTATVDGVVDYRLAAALMLKNGRSRS